MATSATAQKNVWPCQSVFCVFYVHLCFLLHLHSLWILEKFTQLNKKPTGATAELRIFFFYTNTERSHSPHINEVMGLGGCGFI